MKLIGLTPNLITNDLARSLAFYRDVLGFSVKQTVPDQAPFVFAWLERDGVQLFLNDGDTVRKDMPSVGSLTVGQSGVALFVVLEGIADLWVDLKDRVPVVMPLKDQWYGMTEFSITDPDGYVITFAERRGE